MNYRKHYDLLIARARTRSPDCEESRGYTENHHIVPTCMGGSDNLDNRIDLPGREHLTAHLLLAQMFPKHEGILRSVAQMTLRLDGPGSKNQRYEWVRKRQAKATSRQMKEFWSDPEHREQQSQRMKQIYSDPKVREQNSQRIKEYYANNPDACEQHSQRVKEYYKDPEHRKEACQRNKKRWKDPEEREKQSNRMKGKKRFHNPKTKQSIMCFPDEIPDGFIPGMKSK